MNRYDYIMQVKLTTMHQEYPYLIVDKYPVPKSGQHKDVSSFWSDLRSLNHRETYHFVKVDKILQQQH